LESTILLWHWAAFAAFVATMLFLDLFVLHRHAHAPSLRESAGWTVMWSSLALAFCGLVWAWLGPAAASEFLTGYLVEWSLSMDNVFVFAVIFGFFRVPLQYQYRVLFWGILGAVVMRLSFILAGAELIQRFNWVMVVFGAFLIYTAYKLAFSDENEVNPDNNLLMRVARKFFPVAKGDHGDRFFAMEEGRRAITPLFLVLLVIESTDVLFAVDSVPAIFGVVNKRADYFRFIVFTSNVFAILGLRALYFLLAGVMDLFRYLNYGLSAVLAFVGCKMLAEYFVPHEAGHHLIPPWLSLLVIVSLLGVSILASILAGRREPQPEPDAAAEAPTDHRP
jgi:tellurite resistance protein TerC